MSGLCCLGFEVRQTQIKRVVFALLPLFVMFQGLASATEDNGNKSSYPILLGIYSESFLGSQPMIDQALRQLDVWAEKRTSLAGSFISIEAPNPKYDIPTSAELLYQNGYTPFINLASSRSAKNIADGVTDEGLHRLAQAYASWVNRGGGRFAFISPLPEMNGHWEAYKEDPKNFKRAYRRIQAIFAAENVSSDAVRWVFSPNGWSKQQHPFERYYPGDDVVDVVGFSSYIIARSCAGSVGAMHRGFMNPTFSA